MTDYSSITEKTKALKTKEDLLKLLNDLQREEFDTHGLSEKYKSITLAQLNYYSFSGNAERYKSFQIPKKRAGEFRTISTPATKCYMRILHYLNIVLRSVYKPSEAAMGFAHGKSVAHNAAPHVGHNYVFNTDIKDFFPSIEQWRIRARLQVKPLNFPFEIANVIAGLSCMESVENLEGGSDRKRYVLPQGAPTSPIISNMICDKLDRRLSGLAKRFNVTYTRYADDITFSSDHNVYQEDGPFRKELERIISEQSFRMNHQKTRLQCRNVRREVTGITVCAKLNVSQKYVRDIRNVLYIWERYGYSTAVSAFRKHYKEEKGYIRKSVPSLRSVLIGRLLYLKMIKGRADSVYQRLNNKFYRLCEEMRGDDHASQVQVAENEVQDIQHSEVDLDKLIEDLGEALKNSNNKE